MEAELPDPRVFAPRRAAVSSSGAHEASPSRADAASRSRAYAASLSTADRVDASLGATSAEAAAAADHDIDGDITAALAAPDATLQALFDGADSPAVYRHLWRRLTEVMSTAQAGTQSGEGGGIAVSLFAIPLVIVAGCDDAAMSPRLPGTLDDVAALAATLREHGAVGGNLSFALSNAVVGAAAIGIAELPRLRAAAVHSLRGGDDGAPLALAPAPVDVPAGESVHLRFLVGSALTAPGARLFDGAEPGAWAMPLAKALTRALAAEGATVLVLPRAAAALPQALLAGRLAQREVSAQLFVTNALRRMRASIGEPTAIVSAHRLDDGEGELRLSLSSPFSPRDAEGFRCPLFRFERVGDAVAMLDDLLRDCRVTDVRVQPGVHADRDPATGLTLLFKPPPHPSAAA